jgi:hypothetical protein
MIEDSARDAGEDDSPRVRHSFCVSEKNHSVELQNMIVDWKVIYSTEHAARPLVSITLLATYKRTSKLFGISDELRSTLAPLGTLCNEEDVIHSYDTHSSDRT